MAEPEGARHGLSMAERRELASFWTGTLQWDVPMAEYCTMKAGGRAGAVIVASRRTELAELILWLERQQIRWRVIGRGSNILVSGQGYDGVLVVLGGEFSLIRAVQAGAAGQDVSSIRVGAACPVAKCIGWCAGHNLAGIEFMAGIPGSMGGAVCMNAGAWGKEVGSLVRTITVVDRQGRFHEVPAEDIEFSYRRMRLRGTELEDAVVVETLLKLEQGSRQQIIAVCREYVARRKAKQPSGHGSAGSVFKNPPGDSAGRLIEAAGLKGLRRGEAMVSPKHANFIVNTGDASADDILDLLHEVQEKVFLYSGIRLEPEVHIL